jgi:hypothetical protein
MLKSYPISLSWHGNTHNNPSIFFFLAMTHLRVDDHYHVSSVGWGVWFLALLYLIIKKIKIKNYNPLNQMVAKNSL